MHRSIFFLFITLVLPACGAGGGASKSVITPPVHTIATPIHAIQGTGDASPLAGQAVTIVGIVTGDFQDDDADTQNNLGGFFLQEETSDNDARTSDGIFVFDRDSTGADVRLGDKASVAGLIEERFGETRIVATSINVTGVGVVQATDLLLPVDETMINSDGQVIANFERYEGMLVALPQDMTVTDLFDLERFGEVSLAVNGRLQQRTNSNSPDVAGQIAHQRANALRRITLDDGSSQQNILPARYLNPDAGSSPAFTIRVGDRSSNLSGVIRYGRGSDDFGTEAYRLVPVSEPQFESVNVRSAPPAVGGDIRVMSFNALNYFTTIDSGQNICGPNGNSGCRGADSVEEFNRQHAKTVSTILAANAHIVGLMEVENNPIASLQSIVDGLNTVSGTNDWSFIDTGSIGTGAIRVALVYDASAVSPVGQYALLDSNIDPRFLDTRNRKTLAQTFSSTANGGRLTIAVNHLKSKGSNCDSLGDPAFRTRRGVRGRAKNADSGPMWRRWFSWASSGEGTDFRRGAVGALWVLLAGAMIIGLVLGVPRLRAFAAEQSAGTALSIEFVGAPKWVSAPPVWMKGNVHDVLTATAMAELTHDPFDQQRLVAATDALRRTGWFEEIEQVRRVSATEFEVRGSFVQLFAVVRDDRGDHLVDQRGRLLPGTYAQGATTRIALTSPRFARPNAPGEQWEGTDITAGLELLQVVLRREWAKQIATIDIGGYADDVTLVMVTELGKPIIWGRSPSESGAITELSTERQAADAGLSIRAIRPHRCGHSQRP